MTFSFPLLGCREYSSLVYDTQSKHAPKTTEKKKKKTAVPVKNELRVSAYN